MLKQIFWLNFDMHRSHLLYLVPHLLGGPRVGRNPVIPLSVTQKFSWNENAAEIFFEATKTNKQMDKRTKKTEDKEKC